MKYYVEITKEYNEFRQLIIIITNEETFEISFATNLDLYWSFFNNHFYHQILIG